jgi:6,7-dimethyl-8-ribityllumazine synthase
MALFANRLLWHIKRNQNLLPTGPLRIDKGTPLELKE